MSPREETRTLGVSLGIGQTWNGVCFWCAGGRNKDSSYSVTRMNKDTIAYQCHRAKCGAKGYIYLNGQGAHTASTDMAFKPKPYQKAIQMLDIEDIEYITSKYGVDINSIYQAGWARAPEERGWGLAMPVFSPQGELRGAVIRQEFEDGSKEVRSYKILEGNWLCWYRTAHADVVVVEDQISALKASKYATTVALLGAELSPEKLEEIQRVCKGTIWIARDKDATSKTFEDLKRYRLLCNGNLNGLMLSKDFKNMPYDEIRKVVPT